MPDKLKMNLGVAGLVIVAAAKLILSFIPEGRFWGLNQLAYFSFLYSIAIAGMFLVVIAICVNAKAVQAITKFYQNFINRMLLFPIGLRYAISIVISLALFYIFRDSTNLLGDGLLRIGELQNQRLEDFLGQHSAEPLDYLMHYFIYMAFMTSHKISALFSYVLLSLVSGISYILAADYLASKIQAGKKLGFVFWYIIGWGGLMLFFGYVESYSIAAAALMVVYGYCYDVIQKRGNEYILATLYLVSFFLHNVSIVLLPAIIYSILVRSNKAKIRTVLLGFILVAIVGGWILLGIGSRHTAGLMLSESLSEPGYTLFSMAHLGDIVNELLLISPTLLGLIWLLNFRGNPDSRRIKVFFGLAIFGGLAFLFLADPVLGMGRDWDLFALPLLGLHIGIMGIIDWEKVDIRFKAAILVILFFNLGSWVAVNHSAAASVERYKNIAGLDSARSRYAYERLGTYLLLNQNWGKAEEVYKISLNKEKHYRTYLGLAYVEAQMGKTDSSRYNYEKALELKPDQALALYNMCKIYIKEGNLTKARDLFERLRNVSATGIVNITDKGIRELEESLVRAEKARDDSSDWGGKR